MKNLLKIKNKSILLVASLIVVLGLVWSCEEEVYNPGIQAPEITSIESDTAFVSQEVTIYGANFSSALIGNVVSFNGITAEIIETSTVALTVIVPVGAETGDVTVTTNDLTSAGFPFTVGVPIIPAITTVEPDIGKVGTTVTITGTDFSTTPGDNFVTFGGVGAIVTAATETSITVTVPAGAATGDVVVKRDAASNGVLFTVTLSSSVIRQIDDEADDAEEGENGRMANESSDLELGRWDEWTQDDVAQGAQTIGIKFNDITIPAGSVILAASIQFTCDKPGAAPVQLTIFGEMVGNPVSYTDKDVALPDGSVDILNDITSRPRTTVSAVWDVPEWLKAGDAGAAQTTIDLASIIQEIIDGGDWADGNSMAFILEPTGPSASDAIDPSADGREAEAGPGSDAPTLTIIYD
ncbi:MAG: IPT/TIG domain-containing protein [Bacteroidales bacterium]|nr:IPT/TIG domain-containing protein [Bacteroidales bacterium]